MESKVRSTPSSITRSPLAERQPRTTPTSAQSKQSVRSKVTTSPRLPHHGSVRPEGNLSVISRRSGPSRYANNRAVAIYEDELEANKRDSQISTTSTLSNGAGKRKTHIGPWQLGKTLGKGATGRVRLAKHTLTGERAAIKIVSKKSAALVASSSMRRMDDNAEILSNIAGVRTMPFGIEREIVIMKLIEHPNLITLYDIWENRGELYLVMEYVEGGELFSYITRNERLPEVEAVRLLRQLLAGLAYCHRFNICHRDLKPENILLDADHNIKIADFGMAALQPVGETLSTACGSPHYAAPEICAGKHYDGSKVDTWSAGIIFYAMLCGMLPFDGHGTGEVMAKIKKGEYYIPNSLSTEATDLIQRMLQNNPKRRIEMSEIWSHPVMRKHERTLRASLPAGEKLPGPPPELTVADCGPRKIRAEDIDRSLLRNLQILWHGLKESEVIARLTNDQPNYEKLFYWALIRFQEEQQENYPGETLQYSTSDYHHVRPIKPRLVPSKSKAALHQRRNSQFSIVSEDTLSRKAYYRNPQIAASKTTQSSYDPYRASRKPIAGSVKGTTVVVKRPGSRVSHRHERQTSIASTNIPEMPSLDAVEMQRMIHKQKAAFSTVDSQSSMASSNQRRVFRKSTSYRRNVLFSHKRLAASQSVCDSIPETPCASSSRPVTRESCQTFSDSRSTPSLPTPHHVPCPRKTASDLDLSAMRGHRLWRDDTRQVSAELSKICEEAFNRSSLSCASEFSQQGTFDSPATTVSVPEAVLAQFEKSAVLTPALQDLLLRRQRMIDTWGDGDAQTLADLLETLDRKIVAERQRMPVVTDKRIVSDPTHNRASAGYDAYSRHDTMRNLKENRNNVRAVTDPVGGRINTIRLVSPDSTPPMIRNVVRPSKAMPINSLAGGALPLERARDSYDNRLLTGHQLDPILEDPPLSPKKQQTNGKKWTWLSKKSMNSYDDLSPPTPPRKDTPKVSKFKDVSNASTTSIDTRSDGTSVAELEARKRSWFQKVFSKKRKDKALTIDHDHTVVPEDDGEFESLQDLFTPARAAVARRNHVRGSSMEGVSVSSQARPVFEQSWFAKMLHLKPATTILVMNVSKAQARREIVKVLREWRKFGIKDVAVEKREGGDVIRARVDAVNYLRIRPVQFTASIYTVLERGKPAKLALAKFTQERGAASSFHRVLGTIESVLKENDLMLDDPVKRKSITKMMKHAGL